MDAKEAKAQLSPKLAEVLKDNRKLLARLEKEQARTELIVEACRSAIIKMEPPKFTPIEHGPGDPEHSLLAVGDWHFGEYVDRADTMGRNVWNKNVARKQVQDFTAKILRLTAIQHRAHKLPVLNVLMLGDMVTGEAIYEGQQFAIDEPVIDQAYQGAHLFAGALNAWSAVYERVDVHTVNGNHGRSGARGRSHPRTNWDEVLYNSIKDTLVTNDRVNVTIHREPIVAVKINGQNIAFAHGKSLSSGSPMLDTLMQRAANTWPAKLRRQLKTVIFGHYHRTGHMSVGDVSVYSNGSAMGSTSYSVNGRMHFNPPQQWFIGIHPKRTTWQYAINLR